MEGLGVGLGCPPPLSPPHLCTDQRALPPPLAALRRVCEKQRVTPWKGTIREYKAMLAKKMGIKMH